MSDLDTRLAQLVKAEQRVPPPSDVRVDDGWARLARALGGPLPPFPPEGPPDGETEGGADSAADPGAGAGGDTSSTPGASPRPRVHDAAGAPSPVVPLHTQPKPVRIGVWVWPAAAIVAATVVAVWRPWVTPEAPTRDDDTTVVSSPSASQRVNELTPDAANVTKELRGASAELEQPARETTPLAQPARDAPPIEPTIASTIEDESAQHTPAKQPRRTGTSDEPSVRPGLAEELALVDAMRSAFAKDEPSAVLTLGKRHRKIFPQGALREERAALEVRASCRLGRADAATRRDAFLESWPTSAHVERIDRDCASK